MKQGEAEVAASKWRPDMVAIFSFHGAVVVYKKASVVRSFAATPLSSDGGWCSPNVAPRALCTRNIFSRVARGAKSARFI